MKIETKNAIVTSNIDSDNSTDMSIDKEGLVHIMSLLTNLYKDPELAIIREYYSNALDSHIEAGQTRPVEITMPSWDSPVFAVKDYGVGMSAKDIIEIYSQYGASTKRNTNDQVGAFGLGCKSALTIATQFTLVAVKDGFKTTVLVSKTESGINNVKIVNETLTDDPNGVLITIPIPNNTINSFTSKANEFFKFSTPGLLLVNGREPTSVYSDATKIETEDDSDIYLGDHNYYGYASSYIVMGNVPYLVSREDMDASLSRLGIVFTDRMIHSAKYFKVDIGDVDLTPSREGLRFTERTTETLDKFLLSIYTGLKKSVQDKIDALTDRSEVYSVMNEWSSYFGSGLTWNGEEIIYQLKLDHPVVKVSRNIYYNDVNNSFLLDVEAVSLKDKHYIVIIDDVDEYKKTSYYLNSYFNSQGINGGTVIFTDDKDQFDNAWIKENSNFTFIDRDIFVDEAKAYRKKEREANRGKYTKKKTEYRVLDLSTGASEFVGHDEIPANTPYLTRNEFTVGGFAYNAFSDLCCYSDAFGNTSDFRKYLKNIATTDKIILLSHGLTVEALTSRVKGTYNFMLDVKKAKDSFKDLITDDIKNILQTRNNRQLQGLASAVNLYGVKTKIEDKDLSAIVYIDRSLNDKTIEIVERAKAINSLKYSFQESIELSDQMSPDVAIDYSERYPLLGTINLYGLTVLESEHLIQYMNYIYNLNYADKPDTIDNMKGNDDD